MNITHFHRKPDNFMYSIEKLFADIRCTLPNDVVVKVAEMPYLSNTLVGKIKNMLFANKNQNGINHITGDIHYITIALKSSRTILTIHDVGFMNQYKGLKRLIIWFFWIFIPVRKVKTIVAISEETKHDIIRYSKCNPQKIVIIPNFISPKFEKFEKQFEKQCPIILQIGTKFNKNIERLILAIERINCKLIIIGRLTPLQIELLNKYNINFENKFNLSENEIIETYKQADILSFCSLLEGFGLPIIEAQATGRVVVTSNLSSMPDVAGTAACLVDPYDVQSIRNGILKVIDEDDYRNELIEKGFENVKRFSLQTVANSYYELYKEII